MGDEAVELDEAAFIEQQIEPLPGSELAFLMLLSDALGTSALFGEGLAVVEVVEEFSGLGHRSEKIVGSGAAGQRGGGAETDKGAGTLFELRPLASRPCALLLTPSPKANTQQSVGPYRSAFPETVYFVRS